MNDGHQNSWMLQVVYFGMFVYVENETCCLGGRCGRGAGGFLLDLEGKQEGEFSWNLGMNTNNNTHACALWMDLKILSKGELRNIDIFGNPQISVNTLNLNSTVINLQLDRLLHLIHGVLLGLDSYHVFHVRHIQNTVVDDLENQRCQLGNFELLNIESLEIVSLCNTYPHCNLCVLD